MALSDELTKLQELHERGGLTDDEFSRAKARLLEGGSGSTEAHSDAAIAAINSLRRSADDRWIAGVCGGIAEATGIDSWVWRLVFALLLLCWGVGLLVYVLMWIFVPKESA